MTKVSIVTISFNQAEFLERTILSVLEQDYGDIEYIVVDPGSTDGSREIIERYRSRISKIILRPDCGAADGLNHGFAEATGDVFGFVNSDDLLLPGALRKVAEFWKDHTHCDLFMGDGFIVNRQGRPVRHVRAAGFSVARYLYGGTTWLQQATFFRRSTFEATGGFNPGNRSCWDGELFVNMVAKGSSVGYIHSDLGVFRIHAASITGSNNNTHIYAADSARIFHQLRGRDFDKRDELLGLAYRAGRFLRDPGALWNSIRYRIQGGQQ